MIPTSRVILHDQQPVQLMLGHQLAGLLRILIGSDRHQILGGDIAHPQRARVLASRHHSGDDVAVGHHGDDPAALHHGQRPGQDSSAWAAFRPDIIGSVAVEHEGGAYTMAISFTSEAAAHKANTRSCRRNCRPRWMSWRR